LLFPLARSSSLATLFSMRLTFRLRLSSIDRTRLIFCYMIYSSRLPRLPQTIGTRGPRSCQPLPPWTTPETPSGWTRPSGGMVLPTSCPRRPDRLHPHLRLLHQLAPESAFWEPGFGASAFTTAGVRLQLRLHSRRRKLHRPQSRRSCYPRLWHLPRLLYRRLVPRRAPCHRLYRLHRDQLGVSVAWQHSRRARRCKLARGDG
jgi:hypothetical protein